MDTLEMRRVKDELGVSNYKLNYKTGVHLGVIEDFFSGRTDELSPKDRQKLEAVLNQERKSKT